MLISEDVKSNDGVTQSQKTSTIYEREKIQQESFAELVGVSDRQVRNWLTKDTDVSLSAFYNIIQVFNVSMEELIVLREQYDKDK